MRPVTMAAVLGLSALFAGCFTGDDEARRAAEAAGMSDVRLDGTAWFACNSDQDKTGLRFTATNPRGQRVSGVVCCGILKGCTVRW